MRNLILTCFIFVSACAPTPFYTPTSPEILGSTHSWTNYAKTIKDIQIGDLRIKQVRLIDSECDSGYRDVLELDGMINEDASFVLDKLLTEIKNGIGKCITNSRSYSTTVSLNSGGGFIVEGIKVGEIFRKHQVHAHITKGQKCMSSCSTAFFGGIYRSMKEDAEIMMHSPYIKTGFISIQCASTTQATKLKNYYVKMLGFNTGNLLYERTMKYCSTNDGWRLNKDAAELYGILK